MTAGEVERMIRRGLRPMEPDLDAASADLARARAFLKSVQQLYGTARGREQLRRGATPDAGPLDRDARLDIFSRA